MMQALPETTRYLIENNAHMTIATADSTGKPWISPVFFAYDHKYRLYWVSYKNALHSKNIQTRAQIAIVIYGPVPPRGDIDAVYIDAHAHELQHAADIQYAIAALAKRPQPEKFTIKSPSDVTGSSVWRIYQAAPVRFSKRAERVEHEQVITVRDSIKLE